MSLTYHGEERRKIPLLEMLTKRVLTLELETHRQAELLELSVSHLATEQRKVSKEFTQLKDMCRGCAGFGDDYK